MLHFSAGCGDDYAIACPGATCGKVNMSQSFWVETPKPAIKKNHRLQFCKGPSETELLSYLFLLLQVIQSHGGQDGLDFDLEPTDREGDVS